MRPPSSGHSPAKTPHEHSHPGTTQSCSIHTPSRAILRPPRATQSASSTDSPPTTTPPFEAEAAVEVVLVPEVVAAGEPGGRLIAVVDEVAEADDLRVGVGAVEQQLRRMGRVERPGEQHVGVVGADAGHEGDRHPVAVGLGVGDGGVAGGRGSRLLLLGGQLDALGLGDRLLGGGAAVAVALGVGGDLAGRRSGAGLLARCRAVESDRGGVVVGARMGVGCAGFVGVDVGRGEHDGGDHEGGGRQRRRR